MKLSKDSLKERLSLDDIFNLLNELGAEPVMSENYITAITICHGGDSHKLYYYDNTHLFHCYTGCAESTFDIYELICKVKERELNTEWSLPRAVYYIASYFGYSSDDFNDSEDLSLKDWTIFEKYDKINMVDTKQIVELKFYDEKILKYLPRPLIPSWEQEGISNDIIKSHGICYNPVSHGIVIPHYDKDNNLVGIRERTLIIENESTGKYKPAILNGVMYNHPLGFNLYNLNHSKDNIKIMKKAIVFESEKATLQYASYFGEDNDISVACCGSSLINYQVKLLLDLGVQEIIIGFDKQFKELGDDEFKRWTKKLTDIHKKYHNYASISFLFDKENLLGYKDSPTDKGKEVFLELFKRRIYL